MPNNLRNLICKTLLLSAAICLLLIAVFILPVSASQADAEGAISSAQSTLLNCYEAARAAEAAGANITILTGTLNEAGSLLSRAEFAYSTNDFDAAADFAVQSQNKLNTFISQADNLKQAAAQWQSRDFLINVVGSLVGALAVVVVGFVVWIFLKRRYGSNEVGAGESSAI